eukprot:scaffold294_cov221-Amphora_coffeaeformis.AAC.33
MTTFESIQQVNNVAASMLAQGKIFCGGRLCQRGLTILKTNVEADVSKEGGSPHNVSPFSGVEYIGREVEDSAPLTAQLAYSANNAFEIYNCAFSIEGDGCNVDTMAAVILYNLALALHCRGIFEANEASLKKALHFYQASAAILSEELFHGHGTNSSVYSLYMANVSNQCHLFSHWMDHESVKICLGTIFRLQNVGDPTDNVVFYHMIDETNGCGFMRNAPSA